MLVFSYVSEVYYESEMRENASTMLCLEIDVIIILSVIVYYKVIKSIICFAMNIIFTLAVEEMAAEFLLPPCSPEYTPLLLSH